LVGHASRGVNIAVSSARCAGLAGGRDEKIIAIGIRETDVRGGAVDEKRVLRAGIGAVDELVAGGS